MLPTNPLFCPPSFSCRTVSTSQGKINYYEANLDGARTIVFLHGFGGGSSSFEWSKVYPAFSSDMRVLAPDLPGWGFSEHTARNYTSSDYRTAIAEFLDATCSKPATVVASSVVAGLSLWLATESPERFQSLVLMCPTGLSDFGKPFNGGAFDLLSNLPITNYLLYSQIIVSPLSIRLFLENILFANKKRVTEEMVDAYYISGQQSRAEYAAYSFLKGNMSFDLAHYILSLSVPTAILWGEKVNFATPTLGKQLAALSSQVKLFHVIPDTGTVPHLELPAVAIAAIVRALQATTA